MSGTLLHTGFDMLAWAAAGLSFLWLTRYAGVRFPPSRSHDLPYIAALVFGAGIGAFAFGSANLWLSQQDGLARSIEGALAGGIIAVELYKRGTGISGRTGARFALPLAVGVAVGRIGCFFAASTTSPMGRRPCCRGRMISATGFHVTPCTSMRASRWRVSRSPMSATRRGATRS